MNIKDIFKRKKKEKEVDVKELLPILVEYIREARKIKYSDEKIMRQFFEKGYPKELILEAFKLNEMEVKMAKNDEYEEEYEDDEDEESQEDLEEEEDEEEKPKKVIKKKVVKKEEKEEAKGPSLQEILVNHEQRIAALEAKLFRMLNA